MLKLTEKGKQLYKTIKLLDEEALGCLIYLGKHRKLPDDYFKTYITNSLKKYNLVEKV